MIAERPERADRPARPDRPPDDRAGAPGGRRRPSVRRTKKPCPYCKEAGPIDYKQSERLKRFLNERGSIQPRRQTGCCARHQRELAVALKRARQMALLPFRAV